MKYMIGCLLCVLLSPAVAAAHDIWVQTNTSVVRTGDVLHVDLLLGNHGNDHRDFRQAGKASLTDASLDVIAPDGQRTDLKPVLVDTGYAPQEGYWTARYVPAAPGLYLVSHLSDQVLSYGPVRSIKSAKTLFVVSPSLDRVSNDQTGFDRALGHPLELIPVSNTVAPMGPGTPIRVRLLYQGKPLADERISFIPRGVNLSSPRDETYERSTNQQGEASFTPTFGTYYLVVAHRQEPNERGNGYDRTKYSATLCVYVPQVCSCCID